MAGSEARPDIEAAKQKMRTKIGAGREIKRLPQHLWEGESVERMTSGNYGSGGGLVVLTDRRLLFVKDGVMSTKLEDFPLDKISSVQWNSGMMSGSLVVFASGNKAEIKNMDKNDGKEMGDLLRARLHSKPEPATAQAPSTSTSSVDVMAQLKQLGELRDAGVLTPEEFEAKKAELLKRI